MSKEEITGTHVWEACNKEARYLKDRFENVEKKGNDLQSKLQVLYKELVELRHQEVNNVLNYVRTYAHLLTVDAVDAYLCHCQNMLNGNIDGIVLVFTDPGDRK